MRLMGSGRWLRVRRHFGHAFPLPVSEAARLIVLLAGYHPRGRGWDGREGRGLSGMRTWRRQYRRRAVSEKRPVGNVAFKAGPSVVA
jgi:hypothetical protein